MIIQIAREKSFDVPAGKYRATLKEVIQLENRRTKKGWQNQVRLLFELHVPGQAHFEYMAGKNYEPSLATGSELRKDLVSWRGCEFTKEEPAAGAVNLQNMIGKEADLLIRHVKNVGFEKPYVHIKSIQPAGKLVKTVKVM